MGDMSCPLESQSALQALQQQQQQHLLLVALSI